MRSFRTYIKLYNYLTWMMWSFTSACRQIKVKMNEMKENFTLRKLLECTWQNKFLKGHISRKIISLNFPANMYTYSFPYNNNAILKFKRVKISRKSIGWICCSNVHIFPLNPNCSRNFAQRYSLTKTAKLTYCLTCWLTDGRVKTL